MTATTTTTTATNGAGNAAFTAAVRKDWTLGETRRRLPALVAARDGARDRLRDLEGWEADIAAATERAGNDDVLLAGLGARRELLAPALAEAQTAVREAETALLAARRGLLPQEQHPDSSPVRARREAQRRAEAANEARVAALRLAERRDRVAQRLAGATPADDMTKVAAMETELRVVERALPEATERAARAEAEATVARDAAAEQDRRVAALREAALVGDDPDGALMALWALVGAPA